MALSFIGGVFRNMRQCYMVISFRNMLNDELMIVAILLAQYLQICLLEEYP